MKDDLLGPTDPDRKLIDAKNDLEKAIWEKGKRCECCTGFAKVYHRKLHASMARALILIWIAGNGHEREWVRLRTQVHIKLSRSDDAKLRFWGLIEKGEKPGVWRCTELGEQFVRGHAKVMKYVKIYQGRMLGLDGQLIDIYEALEDKFDYNELMGDWAG